jgi:hypothetical protein
MINATKARLGTQRRNFKRKLKISLTAMHAARSHLLRRRVSEAKE